LSAIASILISGGQGRLKSSPASFRRASAEFAADGDFAGDVVEHVVRAFGEDAVALRVGVSAQAEEDIAGVVDVSKAHLRLLGRHSPSWADASNSSKFPASSITSGGTQSGNGVVLTSWRPEGRWTS